MKGSICISLFCLACLACNKPLPDYSSIPFAYSVSGVQDVTVPSNDRASFSLSIKLISGNAAAHPITLTLRGLPSRVVAADSITFRANYNITDSFAAFNATPGTYRIEAFFTSPGTTPIADTFDLVIGPPLYRVAGLAGGFTPSNSCGENVDIGAFFDSIPGLPYQCILVEHLSPGYYTTNAWWDTTYCTIDSFANVITIPSQIVHGATVTGSGYFSAGSDAVIKRQYVTDTSTYFCTQMFSH